jgi:organic radical activating enzyme
MKQRPIKIWRKEELDSKSVSFCGAKWYHVTLQLWKGATMSCHHNPAHLIDLSEVQLNPAALHNTKLKKQERAMMQRGERPLNCQYCWAVEGVDHNINSDRVYSSKNIYDSRPDKDILSDAFHGDANADYIPDYIEIAFERTCQMACSYCSPHQSTSWARDIRSKGSYINLKTEGRNLYNTTADETQMFDYNDDNPYIEAFFKWWETDLHRTTTSLAITGGEPVMSGHLWRFLDWCAENIKEHRLYSINITTNLSYDDKTLDKLISYMKRVPVEFKLCTSVENLNNKAEYVRGGLNWNQFERNINRLYESGAVTNIWLMSTINSPGIEGFREYLNWAHELRKRTDRDDPIHGKFFQSYIIYVRFPTFQNIVVLPMELRLKYSQEIDEFLTNPEVEQYWETADIDLLTKLSTYLQEVQAPHREADDGAKFDNSQWDNTSKTFELDLLKKDFKSFYTQYDQRNNRDFVQAFPNLADWYNNL